MDDLRELAAHLSIAGATGEHRAGRFDAFGALAGATGGVGIKLSASAFPIGTENNETGL